MKPYVKKLLGESLSSSDTSLSDTDWSQTLDSIDSISSLDSLRSSDDSVA